LARPQVSVLKRQREQQRRERQQAKAERRAQRKESGGKGEEMADEVVSEGSEPSDASGA
jgi:hypothetical protein